ncbi:tbc1 domain family member 22a [Anaeramoeba flamelloides]|uniref:Tbc1 domain family member 22a n=1 Tax=Anaeramoeba flamelloides TaxID=1746091 RepID=A0ABQ8YXD6_9EUKA|nr:tbc1 domain family member 22a [Anaeramoeba flamelloides]
MSNKKTTKNSSRDKKTKHPKGFQSKKKPNKTKKKNTTKKQNPKIQEKEQQKQKQKQNKKKKSKNTEKSVCIRKPKKKRIKSERTKKTKNEIQREERFQKIIDSEIVDLEKLRNLSWSGIPNKYRGRTWMLLLGYMSTNKSRREKTLIRKRKEYEEIALKLFKTKEQRNEFENKIIQQLKLDLPRTRSDQDIENAKLEKLSNENFKTLEADIYWCFTKLLDGIQDNYTYANPGIQKMLYKLQEFIHHINIDLYLHLQKNEITFLQFAYKWIHCFFLREFDFNHLIRLWDTYFSETENFSIFHIYVCAALLNFYSKEILKLNEHNLIIFLQKIPNEDFTFEDLNLILAQAYTWKIQYEHAQSHLKN